MSYWIVMKSEGAILGQVRGSQSAETIDGPFETYEEALDKKPRSYGATYYTVSEADSKPESTSNEYEFVDAESEFEDCWSSTDDW